MVLRNEIDVKTFLIAITIDWKYFVRRLNLNNFNIYVPKHIIFSFSHPSNVMTYYGKYVLHQKFWITNKYLLIA
jgi:hypothetical protein